MRSLGHFPLPTWKQAALDIALISINKHQDEWSDMPVLRKIRISLLYSMYNTLTFWR